MTVDKILSNVWEQLLGFVGFVLLVGFLISLLNQLFYRITGYSRAVAYATGIIGTPIHELSHALMCILFAHRITDIQFFQIGADGTMGYVYHASNPKNPYQQLGNYFIGVAPIFVGSMILYFAMMFFLPETYQTINQVFAELSATQGGILSWFSDLGNVLVRVGSTMIAEFLPSVSGWIFIIISMCIALHMNLSLADMIGTMFALPILVILLLVVNLVLGLVVRGEVYSGFNSIMDGAGLFIGLMLCLSLIMSVLCVVIALVMRAVLAIFRR